MQLAFTLLNPLTTRPPLRHHRRLTTLASSSSSSTPSPPTTQTYTQSPITTTTTTTTTTTSTATSSTPHRHNSLPHRQPKTPLKSAAHYADVLTASGHLSPTDHSLLSTLTPSRAALLSHVLTNRTRHLTVVLDAVHGPHNIAAIARSCDAWGIQDLHFVTPSPSTAPRTGGDDGGDGGDGGGCSDPRGVGILERFENESSVRAVSKNCHKWLTIHEHETPTAAISHLRANGYKLYASSLSPSATPISTIPLSHKTAFIFGSESHGVTEAMQQAADGLFTIPMVGFVESMNVSVAVATTAALTIPRCGEVVTAGEFALSLGECRRLAGEWLRMRRGGKVRMGREGDKVTVARMRGDVTRLGTQIELRILRDGLFATKDELNGGAVQSPREYWRNVLRMHGDTGSLLENYFTRRKFGAMGDRRWSTRCDAMTYFISGSHALSVAASIAKRGAPYSVDRPALMRLYRNVCHSVHALYQPHFDSFGQPAAPPHAPEAEQPFRECGRRLAGTIMPVLYEFAEDHLDMTQEDVRILFRDADIMTAARCVADAVRCPTETAQSFINRVAENTTRSRQLAAIIAERCPDDVDMLSILESGLTCGDVEEENGGSSPAHRHIFIHIAARALNVAFLCSQMHEAVWDRAQQFGLSRVRAMRFNFLEAVACEVYSDMQLLDHDVDISLLRVAAEWYRSLWILKNSDAIVSAS